MSTDRPSGSLHGSADRGDLWGLSQKGHQARIPASTSGRSHRGGNDARRDQGRWRCVPLPGLARTVPVGQPASPGAIQAEGAGPAQPAAVPAVRAITIGGQVGEGVTDGDGQYQNRARQRGHQAGRSRGSTRTQERAEWRPARRATSGQRVCQRRPAVDPRCHPPIIRPRCGCHQGRIGPRQVARAVDRPDRERRERQQETGGTARDCPHHPWCHHAVRHNPLCSVQGPRHDHGRVNRKNHEITRTAQCCLYAFRSANIRAEP